MSSKDDRYNRSEKGKARSRAYQDRQVALGLCKTGCGRPVAESESVYCNEHLNEKLTPLALMQGRRRMALARRSARHQTTEGETVG